MKTAVLSIHCPDHPGIVVDISRIIANHGCNILDSQQHREEIESQFFMYVKFDITTLTSREQFEQELAEISLKLQMQWHISYSDRKKNMAIMVSKYDHCLYDLLLRHKYGEINANATLIMSNHADLKNVADHFGIPFFHIPRTKDNRQEADQKALELFQDHKIDFAVMARYMQILTPTILDAFPNKIINVHHGFLPAFKGAKPYHQAYSKGVKIIGATSHYANEELDMGPIIEQETERVDHSYDPGDMIRIGRTIETRVLAAAVKAHAEDRILVYQGRTLIFD